jgi:hypothetical protein
MYFTPALRSLVWLMVLLPMLELLLKLRMMKQQLMRKKVWMMVILQ